MTSKESVDEGIKASEKNLTVNWEKREILLTTPSPAARQKENTPNEVGPAKGFPKLCVKGDTWFLPVA